MFKPGTKNQMLRPDVGSTKAINHNHSYLGLIFTIGRLLLGARIFRSTGFKPTRCSSSAQTSTSKFSSRAFRMAFGKVFFGIPRVLIEGFQRVEVWVSGKRNRLMKCIRKRLISELFYLL